jgi:hypothetical protein
MTMLSLLENPRHSIEDVEAIVRSLNVIVEDKSVNLETEHARPVAHTAEQAIDWINCM